MNFGERARETFRASTTEAPPAGLVASAALRASHRAEMVTVLQALAHPVRLQLVSVLCEGDTCVNALAARLGVAQPIVSQQLRILRMTNVVSVTRVGGQAMYRVARGTIGEVVRSLERCCDGR